MKKCSNTKCNREFADDMSFCPYCGTKWKPMKRVCPNPDCGFDDIPEGANFCPNCQWDLRKNASNAQSHTEKVPFINTEQSKIEESYNPLPSKWFFLSFPFFLTGFLFILLSFIGAPVALFELVVILIIGAISSLCMYIWLKIKHLFSKKQ